MGFPRCRDGAFRPQKMGGPTVPPSLSMVPGAPDSGPGCRLREVGLGVSMPPRAGTRQPPVVVAAGEGTVPVSSSQSSRVTSDSGVGCAGGREMTVVQPVGAQAQQGRRCGRSSLVALQASLLGSCCPHSLGGSFPAFQKVLVTENCHYRHSCTSIASLLRVFLLPPVLWGSEFKRRTAQP